MYVLNQIPIESTKINNNLFVILVCCACTILTIRTKHEKKTKKQVPSFIHIE